jgi:NADPH:quinone reductase-like Zn-dependent oxidoreductase
VKAVIARRYGAPVEIAEVAEPAVGPRDVNIAVRAASLNPLDLSAVR